MRPMGQMADGFAAHTWLAWCAWWWRARRAATRAGHHRACAAWILLLLWLCMGRPGVGQASADVTTGEPPVSAEEALMLRQASAVALQNPTEALELLRRATSPESSAALFFALGATALQAGQTTEALAALRVAVERAPEFARARMALARALILAGQHDEAATQIITTIDGQAAVLVDAWSLLGYARLAAGHAPAAEGAYRQALLRSPHDAAAMLGLIKALVDQGLLAQAEPLVRQQLRNHPHQAELWTLAARIALETDRRLDAMAHLESARRLGIADPETLATLGDLLIEQGLPEHALAVYSEAAALESPPLPRLLRAAERLVLAGRVAESAQLIARTVPAATEETLTAAPRRDLARIRARIALANGQPEEALRLYRLVLADEPLNAPALLAAADLLRSMTRPDEAAQLLERAARLPEVAPDALVRLARLAVDDGRLEQAAARLRQSLELKPQPYVEAYLRQILDLAGAQPK